MRTSMIGLLLCAAVPAVVPAPGVILCVENDGTTAIERSFAGASRDPEAAPSETRFAASDRCGNCVDHDLIGTSLSRKASLTADLLHPGPAALFALIRFFSFTARPALSEGPRVHCSRPIAPFHLSRLRGVVLRR